MSIENNPQDPVLENLSQPKGSEARERLQGIEIHADAMQELATALLSGESLANGMELRVGRRKDPASELFSMEYSGEKTTAKIFVPAAGERQLLPVNDRKGFLNVLIENYLKLQRRANSPSQATAESTAAKPNEEFKQSLGVATGAFIGIITQAIDNDGSVRYTGEEYFDAMKRIAECTGATNAMVTNDQVGHTVDRFSTALDEIVKLSSKEA